MNVYDLLRALIDNSTWRNEGVRADAIETVNQLESMQAFGTIAGLMEVTAHEHQWVPLSWKQVGGPNHPYTWVASDQVCITCRLRESDL